MFKKYIDKYKEIKENIKAKKIIKKYKMSFGADSLYPELKKLGFLLIFLEEVCINSINQDDEHYVHIIFNDNTNIKFWSYKANGWQAFMTHGECEFSNGKKYKWASRMPSYEILYKYKLLLNEDTNNFDEFLPTQLVRKHKLEKLKQ